MNKAELIEALAHDTELSKAAAGRAVNSIIDIITNAVAKKQDVQLIGFGTFKAAKRAARTGKTLVLVKPSKSQPLQCHALRPAQPSKLQ